MSGRCVCSSVHTHTLKQQLLRLNIHVFTKISVEILWEHFQPKGLTWATSSRPNTTTDSPPRLLFRTVCCSKQFLSFFLYHHLHMVKGREVNLESILSLVSTVYFQPFSDTTKLGELVKSNREPSWSGTIQDPVLENQEKKTSRHRRRTCKIYWESRHRTRDQWSAVRKER